MDIIPPYHYDWKLIESLGIHDKLVQYLKVLGMYKFAREVVPAYDELCLEMITTCVYKVGVSSFRCRLLGIEYEISRDDMGAAFGFHKQPTPFPHGLVIEDVWYDLTGYRNWISTGTQS